MLNKIFDKVKKINKKWLIIGGVVLIVVIVLIILFSSDNPMFIAKEDDGDKFAKEYASLNNITDSTGEYYPTVQIPSDNPVKYVSTKEVVDVFENMQSAVVYFGYSSCLYCRRIVPVLIDAAIDKGLEELYYLDIENQNSSYNQLYELLGEELVKDDNGTKTINAPLVVFITGGEVSGYHEGAIFLYKNPYNPMSQTFVDGLKGIYESGMNDVLNSLGNNIEDTQELS